MKKLSVIVVDDERLARKDIISSLSEFEHLQIVGEADTIASAITLIEQHHPDVIFLDIQMDGESGFDLFEKIEVRSKIIFVTAFDEFALKAFGVNALDYLLKPVNIVRLRKSIKRLSDEKEPESPQPIFAIDEQLFLLFNNQYKFIKIDSIIYIASSGDYSEVYLNNGQNGLTSKPMHEWSDRLPPHVFCRIHRSTIVNMNYALHIEKRRNGSYQVFLKGIADPFAISRRYVSSIKSRK